MFKFKKPISLSLFDGGAAPAGAAPAATGAEGAAQTGDTNGANGSTRRSRRSGEYANVKFGKQEVATPATGTADANGTPAAGENHEGAKAPETLEDRRKAFEAMIDGDFKDIYTEKTRGIIDKRFKETKALEERNAKAQPILDALMQRYGIADGDLGKLQSALDSDEALWAEAAAKAGMDVPQFREMERLKANNKALQDAQAREAATLRVEQWKAEGEALKAKYPSFDFGVETENPRFLAMLKAGVPVEAAYTAMHHDELVASARSEAAKDAEKRIVDNVRAKGVPPIENGAVSQSAFTVKDDVSKLSKKDRAEIAKRAIRGDTISF